MRRNVEEDFFERVGAVSPKEVFVRGHPLTNPSRLIGATGVVEKYGLTLFATFSFYEGGPRGLGVFELKYLDSVEGPLVGEVLDVGKLGKPMASKVEDVATIVYSKGDTLSVLAMTNHSIVSTETDAQCESGTIFEDVLFCSRDGALWTARLEGATELFEAARACEGTCSHERLKIRDWKELLCPAEWELALEWGSTPVFVEGLMLVMVTAKLEDSKKAFLVAVDTEELNVVALSPGYVFTPLTLYERLGAVENSVEPGALIVEGNEAYVVYVAGGAVLGLARADLSALLDSLVPFPV